MEKAGTMEKTGTRVNTQDYRLTKFPADSSGDGHPVFGCPVAPHSQGRLFDCRLTFFTLRLGIVLHFATYRDVVTQGSGLLKRLLPQTKVEGLLLQACNVDPIGAFLNTAFAHQPSYVTWVLQYLQFSHDHPGDRSFANDFAFPSFQFNSNICISRLIDMLTVAHFFEVGPLQVAMNHYLSHACEQLLKQHFLIVTEGSPGPLRFKPRNISGLLEQTASAIRRAAQIVPANSNMWVSAAIIFHAEWQVLDFVGGRDQFNQQLLRLAPIGAFASAWLKVTFRGAPLDGIFPASTNWALQRAECACTGCSNGVKRADLVERTAAEIAGGAVQKYALVNPFDGYKTIFCDFCFRRCGTPWDRQNKPCVPHE